MERLRRRLLNWWTVVFAVLRLIARYSVLAAEALEKLCPSGRPVGSEAIRERAKVTSFDGGG